MPTDIYVDDVIARKGDPWGSGITAEGIRGLLDDAPDGEKIRLRINSEGGNVFEAQAIVSELRARGGYDVLIDGLAASAASYIAVQADSVEVAEGAWMMIHNPHAFAAGDHHEMMKTAELLARFAEKYVQAYQKRTGLPEDQIQAAMDAETWISDEEAVALGYADAIAETQATEHAVAACFQPGGQFGFKHLPTITSRVTDAQRGRAAMRRLTGDRQIA